MKLSLPFAATLLVFCVFSAYWPVFMERYVFNDDTFLWIAGTRCEDHPQFYSLIANGRFLFSFLGCPEWVLARSLDDLRIVRFFVLVGFSLGGIWYLLYLRRCAVGAWEALLIVAMTLAMPAFETQLVFAGTIPHAVTFIAAIASAWFWKRGVAAANVGSGWGFLSRPSTWLAALCLFCAMSLYTPLSMFFWVLVAAHFLFSRAESERTALRSFFYACAVFVLAAGPFFAVAKILFWKFGNDPRIPQGFITGHEVVTAPLTVLTIKGKLGLLWKHSKAVLRLWEITDSPLRYVTFWVMALGAAVGFLRRATAGRVHLLIALAVIPLTQLPNLVAGSYHFSLRMIGPLTGWGVLFFYWSWKTSAGLATGRGCARVAQTFALVIMAIFAVTSLSSVPARIQRGFTKTAQAEVRHFKESLMNALPAQDWGRLRKIHVIDSVSGFQSFNIYHSRYPEIPPDEHGLVTSSVSVNVVGFVRASLQETGFSQEKIRDIEITYGGRLPPLGFPRDGTVSRDGRWVIDMGAVIGKLSLEATGF